MKKILIKDSSGEPSVTMTAFVIGSVVANLKLFFSGVTIYGFTVPVFTGTEYAVVLASLGAVYVLRRHKDKEEK